MPSYNNVCLTEHKRFLVSVIPSIVLCTNRDGVCESFDSEEEARETIIRSLKNGPISQSFCLFLIDKQNTWTEKAFYFHIGNITEYQLTYTHTGRIKD